MKYIIKILSFSILFALWSCTADELSPELKDREIDFHAFFMESQSIKTRYDSVYINVDQYNQNFYLMLSTYNESNQLDTIGRIYTIPSGYEGTLSAKSPSTPLEWQTLTNDHTFYGWTIPWKQDFYTNGVNTGDIPITFYNSSESEFDKVGNNRIYETFVGAKSASYSYVNHGKYVDLTFFHLVSKIKIGTLQLTESSGAIQRNLKAEVTFINIPTHGTFHPYPRSGRPYIHPAEATINDTIKYFISNDPEEDKSDIFYISPETDFSKVEYQVKLKDEHYAGYATYYGTFDAVEFERNTPPEDFDSENVNDSKILHAGEMMTININLIPGQGPGLKLVIDKWNTDKPTESKYYTSKGIYSQAEFIQLFESLLAQTSPDDLSALERLFESYGVTTEEGVKYFPLFENVDISDRKDGNFFPMWMDYILDGQGHNLTMKSNSNNWFNGTAYFNIGPARDIYITDPNGQYSIYIDKEGFVWTYDVETNSYNKTENKLESLEGKMQGQNPAYSYNINAKTGQVEYASYYNGKFGY